MDLFALIAVLAGIAFVITRVICRRRAPQTRPPSFLLAIAGAFGAALVMMLILYGRDLFTRRFWHDERMIILVPMFFGVLMVVSLIPALLVVWYSRKRFKDEHAEDPTL
jgi:hypothetical protein